MTARFMKGLHHVSLANEDEEEGTESDTAVLISEDEMTKEHAQDTSQEEGLTEMSADVTVRQWRWKFWKNQRRYIVSHSESRTRDVTLCGRKFILCGINSWRAIFLVLFVFSVAVSVSVIVSKLAVEPHTIELTTQGAVSLDSVVCADMAAAILRQNGSAVDAAITGMLCSGVVHSESSGIGGGGFMTVRLNNGSVYTLNFRETAPRAATEDMFHSNSSVAKKGGLSVAVPGEVKGMERAHQLFGNLPWRALFEPVIDLCRNGYHLTEHTAKALPSSWKYLPENMRTLYRTESGGIKKTGDLVRLPQLADTLEAIAQNGASAFYTEGKIARSIVDIVNASGGILTLEDLQSYTIKMEDPLKTQYNGHTFFAPPAPSGGPDFLFMLSLMDLYHHNSTSDRNLVYHRLVEAFKFAFAERTRLADPYCNSSECESVSQGIMENQRRMFNATYVSEIWANITDDRTHNTSYYHPHFSSPKDEGTTHLSVLAPNGDAVAVTSTINTYFGSYLMTDTGIVLNDEMDDFAAPNITNSYGLPPSSINFIRPGKRPLSSTCPTIAVTETGVSMVIGASGGSRIPTAVAQAVMRALTFEQSISTAIDSKRLHHQLVPEYVSYEEEFSEAILQSLEAKGHMIMLSSTSAVVQGVLLDHNGCVTAHADIRKQGKSVIVNQKPECSNQ